MKNFILYIVTGSVGLLAAFAHSQEKPDTDIIHFATSAEYPPFEYNHNGKLKGYDIELAQLIAKEMGKKAVFDNMQFSSILPALKSGQVDAAISTITITETRKKNFDFTNPYYFAGMAAVFKNEAPINSLSQLSEKKVAVQLGSTMEIWLKKHTNNGMIVAMDNNNQAIEALKAGHVAVVLMDGAQGAIFSKKNPGLNCSIIAQAEDGYGIALKKHAPLTEQINKILNKLNEQGELQKLKKTWLESE